MRSPAVFMRRRPKVARATIADGSEATVMDESGRVKSVQAALLVMPRAELERIWNPMHLERLARTYWRWLSRCTLGLVRVSYTETARAVVLLAEPLRLLRFGKPEYAMDERRGVVRWGIQDGLLVAPRGRGQGYLQIDMERRGPDPEDGALEHVHVEVAVVSFLPSIADRFSRWIYANTQSRVHERITHGFLRSLARLDLAESRVGRFATIDEVPDPPSAGAA